MALLVANPAFAGPRAGSLAFGSSDVDWTPLGIRYWLTNQVGLDLEVGFWLFDTNPNASLQTSSQIKLLAGFPINIWECSDVWLHFRPFFLLKTTSFEDIDIGGVVTEPESTTDFYFGGQLEMETWLLECLSFSVWSGAVVQVLDGGEGADSRTNFHLDGASLGKAGFHLYF